MPRSMSIVALSGGMDSATTLYWANRGRNRDAIAIFFYYGSKHNEWEEKSSEAVAGAAGVQLLKMDLSAVMSEFKSDLLKTGGPVPEGHYEDQSMKKTVVPGRNTIFTSIMLGLAQSFGADSIYLGIHSGDHAIYPDCRPDWYYSMRDVVKTASEGEVSLRAPFLQEDKAGILRLGMEEHVPYHLSRTCYKDQPISCGKCGSCRERLEAFEKIGVADPIPYES